MSPSYLQQYKCDFVTHSLTPKYTFTTIMSVTITQRPEYHGYYAKNTVPKFIITTDEVITATLTMQSHTFTASYVPDFDGRIEIDFGQLYGDYIKTIMPNGNSNSVTQSYALIGCQASFAGSNTGQIAYPSGYPWEWYVFNAKLNSDTPFQTWIRQNFLTNQPLEKSTTYDSPEWLTWVDADTPAGRKLKAVFYPNTGGNETQLITQKNVGGCFSIDVSYQVIIQLASNLPRYYKGYYDIVLTDTSDNILARQRYIYKERSGKEKYFLFVNALGGIDTLICDGENVLQPETTHNIGRFGKEYCAIDDTDDNREWLQQTGMVPYRWRDWMHEVLTMKQAVSLYNADINKYLPIVITKSEISMSDNGQLASASFGYIMTEVDNVMADSERAADRSLHASVAEQAEDLIDETLQVTLAFADDGNGGYETEDVTLAATKLYVEFEPTSEKTTVYYSIDGKLVGDFDPSEDTSPVIITKSADESIQFSSQDNVLDAVVVSYYPITIQSV